MCLPLDQPQKTVCFLIVRVTFQSHVCHFKNCPDRSYGGLLKCLNVVHISPHQEMRVYLYHLCQVCQLYVWISIRKYKAAKSSWDVYTWGMGICWECRHLWRRKALSKRLQNVHKHVMITHTDLSDDVFLVSKLRFEGWKWGEFDEFTILLWTQHCIVEIIRFTKTREREKTFGIWSTTPYNTLNAIIMWLKKKVEP